MQLGGLGQHPPEVLSALATLILTGQCATTVRTWWVLMDKASSSKLCGSDRLSNPGAAPQDTLEGNIKNLWLNFT